MSDTVIRVKNLSKMYRIGETIRHDTLGDTISGFFSRKFRSKKTKKKNRDEIIWALKDVSFEVKKGEMIGIIGRNGAGKTTLLKILSRITEPTEGKAEIKGRVGSLLEVGTGFHPELTGRENIFLNGAVLGMAKQEIKNKLDEIIAFAEIPKFIDTPVKRYSSGMYIRLAFAVAAHLEPEILLVDEVLAVGDIVFQKKCLGKMDDVTKEGRTVLFVSHNMASIRNLCKRTLLIESGKLKLDNDTEQTIDCYLGKNLTEGAIISTEVIEKKIEGCLNTNNPTIRLKQIVLSGLNGTPRNTFYSDESIKIGVTYECLIAIKDLRIVVQIVDEENNIILTTTNCDDLEELHFYRREAGIYRSYCNILPNTFGKKHFYVTVHLIYIKTEHLIVNKALDFEVNFRGYNNVQYGGFENAILRPQLKWKTESLS